MWRVPAVIRRCLVIVAGVWVVLAANGVASAAAWVIQATPPLGNSTLSSVSCLSATNCYAVGSSTPGNVSKDVAEHWDGTTWTVQATPDPVAAGDELSSISCVSATRCMAVGNAANGASTFALAWNGSAWTQAPAPVLPAGAQNAVLNQIDCVSSTMCMAVGQFFPATPLAESWNGSAWTVLPVPVPANQTRGAGLTAVSCTAANQCTAVGSGTRTHGIIAVLAERWNGTKWVIQNSSNPHNSRFSLLFGVSCSSATTCTAVGQTQTGSIVATLAETWTSGSPWTEQTTPQPSGGMRNELTGVTCRSSSDCTAVGGFQTQAGSGLMPLIYSFDGTAWTADTPGQPQDGDTLLSVSCVSGTCTAVGTIGSLAGVTTSTLAEQD